MYRLFILMLLATPLIGCDNDVASSEIPSVVENTFESHFPYAMDVEWEKKGDDFEVDFEVEKTDYSARIDPAGTMLGYKYEIAHEAIPASILAFLNTEYSNKKWDDPEILVQDKNSYYQIEIDGFLNDKKIVLDSEGKSIENIKNWN